MRAVERLRAAHGANARESMGTTQDGVGVVAPPQAAETNRYQGTSRIKGAIEIPLHRVAPDPEQPRKEFDPEALERLAGSLRDRGQIQPIRVRWDGILQKWVIIAGERRWRAAQIAGLATIAAVETQGTPTPDEVLEDQLVENCLRDDLKPIEQARAFDALMNRRGWTQTQLAEHLHLSVGKVSKALAILDLPPVVQEHVDAGRLSPTAAYEVSRMALPEDQIELAERAINQRLTSDAIAAEAKGCPPRARRPKGTRSAFEFKEGTVEVKHHSPEVTPQEVVTLLEKALRKARAALRDAGSPSEQRDTTATGSGVSLPHLESTWPSQAPGPPAN
ncbi:MAG: ParB/RepB/Spo0J family partition protein [Planctomycetaceae bacterium]